MPKVASTEAARRLMHDGALALAEVECAGMRIDVPRLERTMEEVDHKIKQLLDELATDDVITLWKKKFRDRYNIDSRDQLAQILFGELKLPCQHYTGSKKRPSADETNLEATGHPFVLKYLEIQKYKKLHGTYLKGIWREVVEGFLHPFFNLHTVQTFRSCVAKGTLVEIVRDVSKYPKGVPIEEVAEGDLVYCYDEDKNLTIKKVLWAGKTGHRKVVRVHWSARGKHGHIDVTPEHRIRLVSGEYVQAKDLIGDFRKPGISKHAPKIQALAMGRVEEDVYQTGKKEPLLDHRLVFETQIRKLEEGEIIHHIDGNHLNNNPSNLCATTPQEHPKYHPTLTPDARKKGLLRTLQLIKEGKVDFPKGEDNHNWTHVSKFGLLRELSRAGGKATGASYCFDTIRKKCELHGISHRGVKKRYNFRGEFLSRGRVRRAVSELGISKAQEVLGVNYYALRDLCEYYDVDFRRRWGNQFRTFIPNNHAITKIEYLDCEVDVYDLEVEDCHNFIAGELCVHNSSDAINFQNIPIRNPIIAAILRPLFIPRDGHSLLEIDFGAIEVRGAAWYHKDPTMLSYIQDGYDMHAAMAGECFLLPWEEMDWKDKQNKRLRHVAKNKFVFPAFYGDYYMSMAPSIWSSIDLMNLEYEGEPLKYHLAAKGITSRGRCESKHSPLPGSFEKHIQKVERNFWDNRFPVYKNWKESWFRQYQERGWFEMLTGFVVQGRYRRNEVINYPVQGVAFHCLLWSLIQTVQWIKKKKLRSRVIGQIHDSMVLDVCDKEFEDVLSFLVHTMTIAIRKHWPWIITDLEVEAESSSTNWHEKKVVSLSTVT